MLSAVPLAIWCAATLHVWPRGVLGREAIGLGVTIVVGSALFWGTSALLRAPERHVLEGILPWRRRD